MHFVVYRRFPYLGGGWVGIGDMGGFRFPFLGVSYLLSASFSVRAMRYFALFAGSGLLRLFSPFRPLFIPGYPFSQSGHLEVILGFWGLWLRGHAFGGVW